MGVSFISCFSEDLTLFVRTKREVGFQYDSSEYVLYQFDRFCADKGISSPILTKELADSWLSSFEGCCVPTVSNRASVLRQFSLFLLSNGKEAYIPGQKHQGKHRQIHVLSDDEVIALFEQIDQYIPKVNHPSFMRLSMEYRVLFRLLLCCGLRVSEARKLKKEDVDLQAGTMAIRSGKGNKERIIYLPDDLRLLLIQYTEKMHETYNDNSVWFFPAREMDNLMTVGIIDKRFNEAWRSTVFAEKCPDKPTVHCLRHTFVVKRMNAWMEKGIPLSRMLPYLSKYLGHKSVMDTFYYYHQVDTAFRIVHEKDRRSKVIIPEVTVYENNTSE